MINELSAQVVDMLYELAEYQSAEILDTLSHSLDPNRKTAALAAWKAKLDGTFSVIRRFESKYGLKPRQLPQYSDIEILINEFFANQEKEPRPLDTDDDDSDNDFQLDPV